MSKKPSPPGGLALNLSLNIKNSSSKTSFKVEEIFLLSSIKYFPLSYNFQFFLDCQIYQNILRYL